MSKVDNENKILKHVENNLPFNEYLQVFDWLNSHRKVEDLESQIEGLYKYGVSEIRTSMNFDTRYEIRAQVANALTDEIKKPLLEEIAKPKEILDTLRELTYFRLYETSNHDGTSSYYYSNLKKADFIMITKEQYEVLKEWIEND